MHVVHFLLYIAFNTFLNIRGKYFAKKYSYNNCNNKKLDFSFYIKNYNAREHIRKILKF